MTYNNKIPTVYINPTGDDTTGDGTELNPWQTISKAVAETAVDDIIGFENGTYRFDSGQPYSGNNFLAQRFYVGESRTGAILTSNNQIISRIDCSSSSTLENLTLTEFDANTSFGLFNANTGAGGLFKLVDCDLIDILYSGYNEGNNRGIFTARTGSINVEFRRCFIDIKSGGLVGFNSLTEIGSSNHVYLYDSLVYFSDKTSLYPKSLFMGRNTSDFSQNFTFQNNIFFNFTDQNVALILNQSSVNADINYCCIYAVSPANWTDVPILNNTNIQADPRFADHPFGDFSLGQDSPLFSKGTSL